MGLKDLQPELIYQICENLCQHCTEKHIDAPQAELWRMTPEAKLGRQTLLSLCLVNKDIGEIAQKVLFHHVGWLGEKETVLYYLLRTIHAKPDLGKHIRVANLTPVPILPQIFPGHWLQQVFPKFRHLLSLDFLLQNFNIDAGDNGDTISNAIPVVILLQAPHLEHLCVTGLQDWVLFDQLDKEVVLREKLLPQDLKTLYVSKYGRIYPGGAEQMKLDLSPAGLGEYISSFKRLHTLTLCNPRGSTITDSLSIENLRTLRLSDVQLTEAQLRTLLSTTRCLREFVFHEIMNRGTPVEPPVNPQEIFEILASKNDTLRRLVLNTWTYTGPLTMGRKLTNLEELRINHPVFCDILNLARNRRQLDEERLVGFLPPSIRTLHLDASGLGTKWMEEALAKYIMSTYNPSPDEQKLKKVILNFKMRVSYAPERPSSPADDPVIYFDTFLRGKCARWFENGTMGLTKERMLWYEIEEQE
ncbi:hypothetical protein FDECE_4386 [Fusarium decemcellulare]|nr:hypothetical protein FDECE_4386 [Fusarium decemcellulare]